MQQKEIQNIAQKIDEAHGSQIQYTYKTHRPSFAKRVLIFLVVLLLVLGVPYFGYRGTLYLLETIMGNTVSEIQKEDTAASDIEIVDDEIFDEDVEFLETEPVETKPELTVGAVLDATKTVESILADPSLRTYQKPVEGALDAYNLVLDTQKPKADSPLAINQLVGSQHGALGAVYSSMGFAEIDKELLGTEGGTSSLALGANLGQPIPEPRTLEAKTQLLQRVNNALSLDPYVVVATGYNRQETYTKYLRELTNLESVVSKTLSDISLENQQLAKEVSTLSNEQKRLSSDLSKSTDSLTTQGLEEQLKAVNEVSSRLLAAQNRKEQIAKLETLYKSSLQSLQLRIEAVQKNSDAIIQGVKVTPVKGSGVQLTQ